MHSIEELGTNVPAFLAKLWKMVEDPETNDLICWSPNGSSFYIRDQARFARELLPLYYKHNNMASFVRQLNMYGFHKVVSIESGGLKIDRDDMEFAHQCFLMGHPYLLEHIKRKIPTNKTDDSRSGSKPECINKVISEVKSLKGRQDSVDSQLSSMKRENEVLWREIAILRQKHLKQQQIVNKLIQFLVSMVQTSRGSGIGIKRHYPLMLSDITHHSNKSPKLNTDISDVNSVPSNSSPSGPVIHELDAADLLEDCNPVMDDDSSAPVFSLSDAVSPTPVSDEVETSSAVLNPASSPDNLSETVVPSGISDCNGAIVEDPSSDVLMELVEECPVNSDMVLVTPMQQYMGNAKQNKGKQKSAVFKGNKRRKSKLIPPTTKTPSHILAIKRERTDSEEPVNVNNFLEIMLPSLVSDTNPVRPQDTNADSLGVMLPDLGETNDKDQQSSLEDATNAAISAISNVAAQVAAAAAVTTADTEMEKECVDLNSAEKKGLSKGKSSTNNPAETANTAWSKDLTLACAGAGDAYKCKEDLDVHLDSMQSELDSLKELLKGEGYNLDANMLLGVCAAGLGIDANALKLFGDDSLSYGIPLVQEENSPKDGKQKGVSDPMVSGSELMTYSSNLLDLADMSGLEDWGSPASTGGFPSEINDELNTPLVTVNCPGFSGVGGKKKKK